MPSTHYTGKAGQFAVMAELARRGYNVSIPEIDRGDDVFVLNDTTGHVDRIQVKTSTGKLLARQAGACRCQFSVRTEHVNNAGRGGTHYAFVCAFRGSWRFLVMERGVLAHLIRNGLGTETIGTHMISIVFFSRTSAASSTRPGAQNLDHYAGNWDAWPVLD